MFDLLNLEPHKVSKDLSSYTTLIYGVPKAGKTTFAYESFKGDALLIATEKGYGALSGVLKADITKWADFSKLNQQLKVPQVQAKYKVLIIDTIDILHDYAVAYICSTEGVQGLDEVAFGKLYKKVDKIIFDLLKTWQGLGYGLMFISHTAEKGSGIKGQDGNEITKFIPSVNKRTLGIVSKFVDNILFAYLSQDDQGNDVRTLYCRETAYFQAGSRFKHLPAQLPLDAEMFKEALRDSIAKEEVENPDGFKVEKEEIVLERTIDFDAVMGELRTLVGSKFIPGNRMDIVNEVTEKHLGTGRLATECTPQQADVLEIILTELEEKAVELGL